MRTHRPSKLRWLRGGCILLGLLLLVPCTTRGGEPAAPPGKEWAKALTWRSIGPANMSGRITALAVYEKDPAVYYVATASGGLLKTTNNGVTFEHQFDRQPTVSIGDVAVSQSDPNLVWVGTGENNPRNSASYGDGVYKSTDGGKTWKNMGLKGSFQIGKILIHPTNPDVVYVGALGRLWGPNPERGLFKTADGGKTWEKVLYVDENTGVIDMAMHPAEPDTLLVATFERRRDGFDYNDPVVKWGKGSGLFKTTDGGKTFRKVTAGLPTCALGRMGLDYYRKNPDVVFLIVDSEKMGTAPKEAKAGDAYLGVLGEDDKDKKGARLTRVVDDGPADEAGLLVDDLITKFGDKEVASYEDLLAAMGNRRGGDKVKLTVMRDRKSSTLEVTLGKRPEAEGGGERPFSAYLGGQRENVQDKQGPEGFQYGGVYKSTDGGDSWTRVNSLNPRPMYFSQVRVDPGDDRYLYVLGISLHRSKDGGQKFTADAGRGTHADHHALWINPRDGRHMVLGNDGGFYVTYDRTENWDHLNNLALGQFYHVAVDPRPLYKVYGGLQDNGTWGGPAFTLNPRGPVNADWVRVGGGDGFRCQVDPEDADLVYFASQYGNLQRRNFRTGKGGPIRPPQVKGVKYRFNWNTPFILSGHNSRIYYCAGNYVFRSLDRGNDLQTISPEITLTDQGSASALAESPKNPNVLYAGTDDGALWITRDGGAKWANITKNVGLPGPRWVASIEASRHADGRAYVVFDGHRSDDDEPYVYATEDYGQTWKSLRGNLPWGSTRVLREDAENADLLYLGTEFGVWCSLDRGQNWVSLNSNLPTVAVHEFAIHPTAGEIVAATHGRSLWVLDITPLRQIKPDQLARAPQLFKPATAVQWISEPARGATNREFAGQNRPLGVPLYYSLPDKAGKISLTVLDAAGKLVQKLKADNTPGLHQVSWNLAQVVAAPKAGMGTGKFAAGKASAGGLGTAGKAGGGGPKGGGRPGLQGLLRPVPPGTYRVVLDVDGQEFSQTVQVLADPSAPSPLLAADQEEQFWEEEESEEEHGPID